jgi:hypothetical protein
VTLAEETPGLAVTVLDLPGAGAFFREKAVLHPGVWKVVFRAGDYGEVELGGPYDVSGRGRVRWPHPVKRVGGAHTRQALGIDISIFSLKL